MKKIFNINSLLIIFFTTIFLNYFFFLFRIVDRANPWIVGDWLINYENGLIRRGLFGEIFLLFIQFFNFEVLKTLFISICILAILFYYYSFKIIKNSNINFLYLILILSPATYLFTFYDPLAIGRKEILIFVFFGYYIANLSNQLSFSNKIYFLFFFLIGIFLVLTHEIIIFFMFFPLFMKFLILEEKSKFQIKFIKSEIFFILGCFFGLIAIIYFSSGSDPNTPKKICDKILSFNVDKNICYGTSGAIKYTYINKENLFNVINYTKNHIKEYNYINYLYYLSIFISSIIFIYIFIFERINKKKNFYFIIFNSFQLISLSILFVIVNDWGRYLNIFFITNSLIFIKFFSYNLVFNKFIKVIIFIIIISNTTIWHMPHCCKKEFGNGAFSLKERITIRLKSANGYEDKSRDFLLYIFKKFGF